MNLDTLAKKATAITSVIGLLVLLATGLNAYHSEFAKAEEVDKLASIFTQNRIDEYEEKLVVLESQIAFLTAKQDKTESEMVELSLLTQRRVRYLETLKELKGAAR